DHGQAPMDEAEAVGFADPVSAPVRSADTDGIAHRLQQAHGPFGRGPVVQVTGKSAQCVQAPSRAARDFRAAPRRARTQSISVSQASRTFGSRYFSGTENGAEARRLRVPASSMTPFSVFAKAVTLSGLGWTRMPFVSCSISSLTPGQSAKPTQGRPCASASISVSPKLSYREGSTNSWLLA